MLAMAAVCAPASAAADGLPVGNVDAGPGGVASRTGELRYLALPAGPDTLALAIRRDGGQVQRSRHLRGRYAVPVVALDGTVDGLSADGRTLVLIRPRTGFPRSTTTFAVLDAREMRVREVVRLRGDFSYYAMSPDGGLVYLIQYTSRRDPTRYEVRAFDTREGRLVPGAIIDKREPDENMRGYPLTRAMSPDGRWAYTLYDGAGKHPFVHALDTRDLTAACIDLHALEGRTDLTALGLDVAPGGGELSVVDRRDRALAVIDAKTFEVSAPVAEDTGADGSVPPAIWLGGAGVVALSLCAVVLLTRRRRAVAAT